MNLVDMLFSATLGGGVVGSALHLVTDWADRKNKIALMEAQSKLTEQTEAWKAFTAAQESNTTFSVPANAAPWASTLYTCVAALKDLTRPLLTWSAVAVVVLVYAKATADSRAAIAPEILAASYSAIFFWFGSRYTRK